MTIDLKAAAASLAPRSQTLPVWRVCTLLDPRLSVERLPLTDQQKLILYRRHGFRRKPDDRDIIQRHVQDVFARPLKGRADRYSRTRHALYGSVKRATAEGEMLLRPHAVLQSSA